MALAFEHVAFYGIDKIEPKFDPNIRKYTIYRRAGTQFSFQAILNRPPAACVEYYDPQYPGYSLEYHVGGHDTKDYWSVGNAAGIDCMVGECYFAISIVKSKRNNDPNAESVHLNFDVITASMSEEAAAACTHPHTQTSEGECWGGGSGSCQVEMINSCCDCGATLSKWYDHRD